MCVWVTRPLFSMQNANAKQDLGKPVVMLLLPCSSLKTSSSQGYKRNQKTSRAQKHCSSGMFHQREMCKQSKSSPFLRCGKRPKVVNACPHLLTSLHIQFDSHLARVALQTGFASLDMTANTSTWYVTMRTQGTIAYERKPLIGSQTANERA